MGKAIIVGIVVFIATVVLLSGVSFEPNPGASSTMTLDLVPDETADALFAREVAAARALGFEETYRQTKAVEDTLYHPVELAENRCIAIVAAMSGHGSLGRLNLMPSASDEVARDTETRAVQHVQACFSEKFSGALRAQLTWGVQLPERMVRLAILEAPLETIRGNAKLNRGWVPLEP